MELKVGQTGLLVPAVNKKFNMTLEAISAWYKELPVADVGETAREIYSFLKTMNISIIDPKERFSILNIVCDQVMLLCNKLRKIYWKHTSILSAETKDIFDFVYALQNEALVSYKLVIEDLFVQNIHDKEKDLLVGSLCYISRYYISIMLRFYQAYQLIPSGVWLEVYKLYGIIEKHDLFDYKVTSSEHGITGVSAANWFKQIILLAALKPYKWQQVDQETIHGVLAVWEQYVTIKKYPQSNTTVGFLFNTTLDTPPVAKTGQLITPGENVYILELDKAIEHLQELLHSKVTNVSNSLDQLLHGKDLLQEVERKVSVYVVHNVLDIWAHDETVRATRFTIGGKFNIAIGWVDVHYYIANKKAFNAEDVANKVQSQKIAKKQASTTEISIGGGINLDELASCQYYACNVLNISSHGCCLLWQNSSDIPLQPGDLVAINPSDDVKGINWSIGTICWLCRDQNNTLRIGIKILAARVIAAAGQIIRQEKISQYLRCFIVPEMPESKTKASLITSIFPFQSGSKLNLYNLETESCSTIVLGDVLASSGRFKQFAFNECVEEVLIQEEDTPQKTVEIDKEQDKFKGLFSKL